GSNLCGFLDGVEHAEVTVLAVNFETDVPAATTVGVHIPHSRFGVRLRAATVAGVLRLGHGAEVGHVDAGAVEANMVQLFAFRNGAVSPLPGEVVNDAEAIPADVDPPIPVLVHVPIPN